MEYALGTMWLADAGLLAPWVRGPVHRIRNQESSGSGS